MKTEQAIFNGFKKCPKRVKVPGVSIKKNSMEYVSTDILENLLNPIIIQYFEKCNNLILQRTSSLSLQKTTSRLPHQMQDPLTRDTTVYIISKVIFFFHFFYVY